jgi:hypothetical protein
MNTDELTKSREATLAELALIIVVGYRFTTLGNLPETPAISTQL